MHELWNTTPMDDWPRLVVDAAWQSTLLGLVAWLVSWVFVGRASLRAWLALVAVSLSLVMPALTAAVRWAGIGLLVNSADSAERPVTLESHELTLPVPLVVPNEMHHPAGPAQIPGELVQGDTAVSQAPHPVVVAPSRPFELGRIGSFLLQSRIFAWAWLATSAMLALRLTLSFLALGRLLRRARPCDDPQINSLCRQAAARLGLTRLPLLAISDGIALPALAGLGKPRILVPEGMLQQSNPDWLTVFCHELAHLRRGDTWGRLLVELARTALPWQPLVWLLGREYYRACEETADDWVVWTGTDPLDLAMTLTNWAAARSPRLATAVAGMSEPKWRIMRLTHLTRAADPRLRPFQLWGGTATAVCVAGLLPLLQVNSRPLAAEELNQKQSSVSKADASMRVDPYGDPLPEGASFRLGTIRLRHRSLFSGPAAFSPDGRTIASASNNQDWGVYLWDVATGRLIRHLAGPANSSPFGPIAFSPDGRALLGGCYHGSVMMWHVGSGEIMWKAKEPEALVQVLAFAPDGKRFAGGGSNGNVHLWNATGGKPLRSFDTGIAPPKPMATDSTVFGPTTRSAGDSPGVVTLAFSPSGSLLAAGIQQNHEIRV